MKEKEVFCLGQSDDGKPVVLTTLNSLGLSDAECDMFASSMKTLYDSFVHAGFSKKEAMDLLGKIVLGANK